MKRPRLDPVVWRPPPWPERARRRVGPEPFPALRTVPVGGHGPEDVAIDATGAVLTGVEDGRVLRVDTGTGSVRTLADTGGRPLGLEVLPDRRILVCDARRGLLRLDPATGEVATLVSHVAGERLRFCSNAVADQDGTVYFTSSTARFDFEHWRGDIMEHSGTGRLMRLDPGGEVSVLLDGLQFANGVALAADRSFVVVAETGAYRLSRYWLAGPRAGRSDVFVDNLPGFPDNISRGPSGLVWVALASARDPRLDLLHRLPPIVRRAVWAVPERWQPRVARTVWVIGVDDAGQVVRDLQAPGERYGFVTGVAEHGGRLYLGSLTGSEIAVLDSDLN